MNHIDMIRELHTTFKHPAPATPTPGDLTLRLLRIRLLAEELQELAAALGFDFKYRITLVADKVNMVEAADALGDLEVVVLGGQVAFGIPGPEVFREIHRSNMSKLGADGEPILRDDGKFLKGPNYSPPDIAGILLAHGYEKG